MRYTLVMSSKKEIKVFEQLICSCNNNIMKKGFCKYFEFISCLIETKQNNEFLMKNHVTHPTGSPSFP